MQQDTKSTTRTRTSDNRRATPWNTPGMGNPAPPGMSRKKYECGEVSARGFHDQRPGSGDFL